MLDRGWQSRGPEYDEANPVDASEDKDRLVLAEILVRDDGTEDRRDVAEELEEDV